MSSLLVPSAGKWDDMVLRCIAEPVRRSWSEAAVGTRIRGSAPG
jgi:hypothetical protein